MKAALLVEQIGDNLARNPWLGLGARGWVDELIRMDWGRSDFVRMRLHGKRDYARANGVGSRGINELYLLEWGRVYEVRQPISWRRSRQYYAGVSDDGDVVELTREQVEEVLCGH